MAALVCHGVLTRFPDLRVAVDRERRRLGRPVPRTTSRTSTGRCRRRSTRTRSRRSSATSTSARSTRTTSAALIDAIGTDHVLFGSDYPHPEGLAEPCSYVDHLPAGPPRRGRRQDHGRQPGPDHAGRGPRHRLTPFPRRGRGRQRGSTWIHKDDQHWSPAAPVAWVRRRSVASSRRAAASPSSTGTATGPRALADELGDQARRGGRRRQRRRRRRRGDRGRRVARPALARRQRGGRWRRPGGRTVGRDGTPHDKDAFVATMEMNAFGTFNVSRLGGGGHGGQRARRRRASGA